MRTAIMHCVVVNFRNACSYPAVLTCSIMCHTVTE